MLSTLLQQLRAEPVSASFSLVESAALQLFLPKLPPLVYALIRHNCYISAHPCMLHSCL